MTISLRIPRATRALEGAVAALALAACAGGTPSSSNPATAALSGRETGLTNLSKIQDAALTMPHFLNRPVYSDHGKPFMRERPNVRSSYLYVGDWATNDVDVYKYPGGSSLGTLTGFSEPYGMCVDRRGDIFITNFGAGDLAEYRHGGTAPIDVFSSGGEPIGCSISAKGDVAVTSFDPGEVTVYPGGNNGNPKTYSNPYCALLWTMGYDPAGNLIGVGETSSGGIVYCGVVGSPPTMAILPSKGLKTYFPGGTTYDGRFIALGDQEAGGAYLTGVLPAVYSGGILKAAAAEVVFSDSCYGNYADDVNPFFTNASGRLGNITPLNRGRAKWMVGPNLWCNDAGTSAVNTWSYPAGGLPSSTLASPPSEPYGAAVSVGI